MLEAVCDHRVTDIVGCVCVQATKQTEHLSRAREAHKKTFLKQTTKIYSMTFVANEVIRSHSI